MTSALLSLSILIPMQSSDTEGNCGLTSLYVALKSFDVRLPSYKEFAANAPGARQTGIHSLQELSTIAQKYVPFARNARVDLDFVTKNLHRAVVLIHWKSHFAIVSAIDSDSVRIIDPPSEYLVSHALMKNGWTGEALILSEEDIELPLPPRPQLRWTIFALWMGAALLTIAAIPLAWTRVKARFS